MKAARAVLADHENFIDKLKEAEPWLFEGNSKHAAKGGSCTTGLLNAGAATDSGKQLRHWREVAGLTDVWRFSPKLQPYSISTATLRNANMQSTIHS